MNVVYIAMGFSYNNQINQISSTCTLCLIDLSAPQQFFCTACLPKCPSWVLEKLNDDSILEHHYMSDIVCALLQYVVSLNSGSVITEILESDTPGQHLVKLFIRQQQACFVDVPDRSCEWSETHACYNHNINCHCELSHTTDHRIAFSGRLTEGFKRNATQYIEQLWILKNASECYDMNVCTPEQAYDYIASNPYFNFVRSMDDRHFDPEGIEDYYFACLYSLRELMGDTNDYGYKTEMSFVAQGLYISKKVSDFWKEPQEFVNQGMTDIFGPHFISGSTGFGILDILKRAGAWLCKWAKDIVGKLGEFGTKISDFVGNMFVSMLLGAWVPQEVSDKIVSGEMVRRVFKFAILGGLIAACVCGMIPFYLISQYLPCMAKLDMFIQSKIGLPSVTGAVATGAAAHVAINAFTSELTAYTEHEDSATTIRERCAEHGGIYNAQGANPIDIIIDACVHFFEIDDETVKQIRARSKIVMLYAGAAGATIGIAKMILLLLPESMRITMLAKFGSSQDKLRHQVNTWKSSALSLITCAKLQNVVFEAEYGKMVTTTIKSGMTLNAKLNTPGLSDLRTGFLQVLSKLIQIKGDLEQLANAQKGRSRPFAFHIAGKAGIGKSTIVKSLIRDVTGLDPDSEMYTVPKEDQFWNGYGQHPIILMDEFLVGVEESNQALAQLYLSLVSNQTFYPPMASVDNMAMGMKGAVSRPSVVVTMNNTTHDRPACFQSDAEHMNAFQRRRTAVIEIVRSSNYHHLPNEPNNIDYSKYTNEEMSTMAWARFRILPGQWDSSLTRLKTMDYNQMVSFMQAKWEAHQEACTRFEAVYNSPTTQEGDNYDVKSIIAQLQKDCFDIPAPKTITETVMGMIPLFCQGPAKVDCNGLPSIVYEEDELAEIVDNFTEAATMEDNDYSAYENEDEIHQSYASIFDRTKFFLKPLTSDRARSMYSKVIKYGVIFGSALALIYGIRKVLTGHDVVKEEEEAAMEAQNYGGHKPKFERALKGKKWTRHQRDAQGPFMGVEVSRLHINGYFINCIPLKQNWFITYYHGLLNANGVMEDYTDCNLDYKGRMYEFVLAADECRFDVDSDIAVFRVMNNKFPAVKNNIKHFVSRYDLPEQNVYCMLETQNGLCFPIANLVSNIEYVKRHEKANKVFKLENAYKYNAPTVVGDCGSPLAIMHGKGQSSIAGIHVAGSGLGAVSPVGIATIITRECLQELFDELEAQGPTELCSLRNLVDHINDVPQEYPNVISAEMLPREEHVKIGRKTKVEKTAISPYLQCTTDKVPAILSPTDPRSGGLDPAAVNLSAMCKKQNSRMDKKKCQLVMKQIMFRLNKNLNYYGNKREFTFEEALAGIPGKLASLNMKTSPGWPLKNIARQQGKKDFCWFDEDGELQYTPIFKELCEERYRFIKTYRRGTMIPKRSLGYLKDECRSAKKIAAVSTRSIFCDDLITVVALRMHFGHLLLAFNNSFPAVPYAIGINQYSHDFALIADVLTPVNDEYVAGDFSNFDGLYDINLFEALLEEWRSLSSVPTEGAWDFIQEHVTQIVIQFEGCLLKLKCINPSGILFTTPFNCMMNEGYHRYGFMKQFPLESFDRCVSGVYLGDDHTLAFTSRLNVTPKSWGEALQCTGQKYTSATKGELEDYCSPMEECPFLGAYPRRVDGIWSGAMREETLDKMLHYSRGDLNQTITCVLDLASQHPKEVYERYRHDIEQAYFHAGLTLPVITCYEETRRIQAGRTADSGSDFSRFWAQGPIETLTKMTVVAKELSSAVSESFIGKLKDHAINASEATIDYGLNSYVKRATLPWSSSDAFDTILANYSLPYSLLNVPSTTLQGMNFNNFVYGEFDMHIKCVINGLPTQAGSVIVAFSPLSNAGPNPINLTALQHAYLVPSESNEVEIVVPYKFFRTWMNTQVTADSLGGLLIKVFSPLSSQAATSCEITVYSKFVGDFRIPKPVYVAQGGNVSTQNTYTISNVGGDIPLQTTTNADAKSSLEGHLQATMPMDNPPIVGSGLIVAPLYPSLCKTVGLAPTVPLALHNQVMSRQPLTIVDREESTLDFVFNRQCVLLRTTISTNDAVGAVKFQRPMNSLLGLHNTGTTWSTANAVQCPINLALMNQFARWRADIVLDFYCIKTQFHATRVALTVGYGVSTIADGSEHKFINHMLDFNSTESWQTVHIPFNASQEFLRTFNGGGGNQLQDYSMGTIKLTVLNPLKVSGQVVSTSVELIVFVRLENVRVAVMKPSPLVMSTDTNPPTLFAQGPEEAEPTTTTTMTNKLTLNKPCKLNVGDKYEFTVADIHEPLRRYYEVGQSRIRSVLVNDNDTLLARGSRGTVYCVPVYLDSFMNSMYRAWSGTIKFRIYGRTADMIRVWYDPDGSVNGSITADTGVIATIPGYGTTANWSPTVLVRQGDVINNRPAVEVTYDTTANTSWIDVSVPFCSEKNYLPTTTSLTANNVNNNYSNGTLYIQMENTIFVNPGTNMTIFAAAGDDFRYHTFNPRDNFRIQAYNANGVADVPELANAGQGTVLNGNWLTTNIV